jgi:membrane-associated protein
LNWLNAQEVVNAVGGYAVLVVCVFVFFETAIIFTSFLPGDSLLFILGITLATATSQPIPFPLASLLVLAAAIAGSQVGFEVGAKIGPPLFERNHNWIFNPKVVERTHQMFEKYGARAVILARFVPIIRALVPMLAGISYLERPKFLRYNLIGGATWVVGFMGAGYFLGGVPIIHDHLDQAVLAIVVLSSLPFPIELLRHWLQSRKAKRGQTESMTR